MLEFVGIGDLHMDKLSKLLPGFGNAAVAAETRKVLDYAKKHGVVHVFYYGDVCDKSRMSYSGHTELTQILFGPEYADLNHWVILGNHDFEENGTHSLQVLQQFAESTGRSNVHIITQPTETKIDGVRVRFLPYPHESTSKDALNVGHFEAAGALRDNGKRITDGYSKNHLCAMGHLHTMHQVRRMYYSGTLYQTNFGEKLPKFFHHAKVMPDLRHKFKCVRHTPSFTLTNLEVRSRADLKKVSSNPLDLYKLFVHSSVKLRPDDLEKLNNVVRINKFETEKDLKTQLADDWKVSDEEDVKVFQPKEDLLTFLHTKNIREDLKKRVLQLHEKAFKSYYNSGEK